jgi:hypothetical protein
MFDANAIPVAVRAESHAMTTRRFSQRCRAADGKHGVVDGVFLTEIAEKALSDHVRARRLEARMKQIVCVGIDGSVQPVPFVVKTDYRLVDRDVIRAFPAVWL